MSVGRLRRREAREAREVVLAIDDRWEEAGS
jgi:hypothetical protein